MYCKKCLCLIPEYGKYCIKCGKPVSKIGVESLDGLAGIEHMAAQQQAASHPVSPVQNLPSLRSGNDPLGRGHLGKWNWGAFCIGWIWSFFNAGGLFAVIGLISSLVPFGALVYAFFMGLFGNDLAWENRTFRSARDFRDVQSVWGACGVLAVLLVILGVILCYQTGLTGREMILVSLLLSPGLYLIYLWNCLDGGSSWIVVGVVLALIPLVYLAYALFIVKKGYDLSWVEKRFKSVENFREFQDRLAVWGYGVVGVMVAVAGMMCYLLFTK